MRVYKNSVNEAKIGGGFIGRPGFLFHLFFSLFLSNTQKHQSFIQGIKEHVNLCDGFLRLLQHDTFLRVYN